MWFLTKAKSLTHVGLRASALAFRFGLSFYIVKFLGLEATGLYGLALGVISLIPAAIGWGMNYFVARDIVGQMPALAGATVKSRLFLTFLSLLVTSVIAIAVMLGTGVEFTHVYLLIFVLCWLETFAMDIHIPLIAQEMAVEANVIIFIRSALWVPFLVGLSMLFPALRSIEWVFAFWILAYVPTILALFYFLRHWPMREIAKAPIRGEWLRMRLKGSWLIYLSDISLVGLMYADRYVVNFVLGLTLTGIYTFFWSLTNALQTLITTAVVQTAMPIIFKAFNSGSMVEWRSAMRQQFIKTVLMSTVLGTSVLVGAEVLMHVMNMQQLLGHRLLFILMLLAAIIRACSDLLNVGLTSMKKDKHYALTNLFGVGLTIGIAYVMLNLFGLIGAGVAALLTALIIAGTRGLFLFHFERKFRSATSNLNANENSET